MSNEQQQKVKKPIYKRWWFWLIIVVVVIGVLGGNKDKSSEPKQSVAEETAEPAEPTEAPAEETAEPTPEQTPEATEAPEEENTSSDSGIDAEQWPELAALGLSNDVMLNIYNDFEKAWETYPEDVDEAIAYEQEVTQAIADAYGITTDQASMVDGYVLMNYEKVASNGSGGNQEYVLEFGEFLESNTSGSTIVIKARISSSLTNKMTIEQNYYNVCDLIRNQGLDIYNEIRYWAVADMSDGSESKVISFTVPKSMIDIIANEEFADNQLGDYVEDLWVLPSLQS